MQQLCLSFAILNIHNSKLCSTKYLFALCVLHTFSTIFKDGLIIKVYRGKALWYTEDVF